MAYRDIILAEGPLAYWALDDTTGTTATDLTGNGNTGTYTGGFTLGVPGPNANLPLGVALNGSTGFVSIGSPADLVVGSAWTAETWVKCASFALTPVIWGETGSSWATAFNTTGTVFSQVTVASVVKQALSQPAFALNTWVHLVGVWDGASVFCYANGQLVGGPLAASGAATLNTGAWSIGQSGGSGTHFLNGAVSNAAVYGKALSAAQILAHYQSVFPPTTPSRFIGPASTLRRGVRSQVAMTLYRQRMPQPVVTAGPVVNQSSLTAALSFTGSEQQAIGTTLAAVLAFTGSTTRATVKLLAAALTFTGALVKTIAKRFAGALSFSGALSFGHMFAQALTAALTFAGSQARQTAKKFTAALSFTGARALAVGRLLEAGLSFTGAQARSTATHLTGALTFAGALTKQTAKRLAGVLTFSGGFTTQAVHFFTQAFTATLTFTGATTRRTGKALTGALSFTGKQSRVILHTLTAVVSFTGAQARAITQHLTAALTSTGRLTKSIGKKIAGALSFVGNLVPVHNGPSNAPPTICYPTTALIVPYASAPGFAPRETGVTMRPYTTTTTIPARSSSIAIAPRSTVGSITGHDTAGTLVIYTSGVTHFNTCND